MTFVSASWGFDPQTVSGGEIVRECMPERMSLRLDEFANGEKTKAMVLAVGVDPLDALAQSVNRFARFARHPLPPGLEAKGFFRPLSDPPRKRGRLDVLLFARRGRIDLNRPPGVSGTTCSRSWRSSCRPAVGRRPAVAAGDVVDPRPRQARIVAPVGHLDRDDDPLFRGRGDLGVVGGANRAVGKAHGARLGSVVEALSCFFLASSLTCFFARDLRSA